MIKQGMLDEKGRITDAGRQALERKRQEVLKDQALIVQTGLIPDVPNAEDVTLNALSPEDVKKITRVTFKVSDVKMPRGTT